MMLKTYLGPIETEEGLHYLRPETAQGIFVNFANVVTTARKKPPFGIGQIGKSFRNEITPGNFIFRTREFEQMEMEFFVEPSTARRMAPVLDRHPAALVRRPRHRPRQPAALRPSQGEAVALLRPHRRHRVQVRLRRATRGVSSKASPTVPNFDLSTHSKHSGVDLSFYDQATDTRYVPYVIEPAAGLTRSLMAFLVDAYHEDEAPNAKGGVDKRTVLQARSAAGAGQGRGAAAVAARRPVAEGA